MSLPPSLQPLLETLSGPRLTWSGGAKRMPREKPQEQQNT